MNIDIIGKFYLGNGGIGDALLFLSTFYDDVDEANVIFLANDRDSIIELLQLFPKIQKRLIMINDFKLLKEFYYHPNCIGTGILPKNLDYSTWYKVDIFKEYGVKEFPEFMKIFEPIKIDPTKKQIFVQNQGSNTEGSCKKRILTEKSLLEIQKIIDTPGWKYAGCFEDTPYEQKSLKKVIQTVRGSDLVVSVDSFVKTVSSMSNIETIVYDNIYDSEYLKQFKEGIDYGHYVFLFPWSRIELRQQ